jgi:hypothetical protein
MLFLVIICFNQKQVADSLDFRHRENNLRIKRLWSEQNKFQQSKCMLELKECLSPNGKAALPPVLPLQQQQQQQQQQQ